MLRVFRPLLLLAALTLPILACTPGQQTTPAAQRSGPSQVYTMEQLMKTVTVFGGSFSPDESKLLVSTNESGVFNLAVIDLTTGTSTSLTENAETTRAISYFPSDERILLSQDQGGNELAHLYLREQDGTTSDLTGETEVREVFQGWARDLQSFYTTNNRRDQKLLDLYEWPVKSLEPQLVYQNDEGYAGLVISPNRRWLVVTKMHTTNSSDLYLIDLGAEAGSPARAPRLISEHEGDATFEARTFSADSRYLYYTADDQSEFAVLRRYELATGTHEEVLAADWGINVVSFSHNDTYRVIGTNEDGYTRVSITRTDSGEELELPELPPGVITGVAFSRSEQLLRFYLSSDSMPANLYLFDLRDGTIKQLTDNLNPEVNPDDLVASEVVRFTARDGMEIPGLLYKPIGASAGKKVPVLVSVHGGPGGQSMPMYNVDRQLLLNHGYGIFAVNNRGSSGYGKSFLAADDQRHGHEPLWDCVDAKQYLQTLDWVDGERIGIMGGSYGGYMVLAALAFEPEEFAVGVDLFGVANWLRTLRSIPPYWEPIRKALYAEIGHPEEDEQMLREISPVFHGDKIKRPLLILQGANDPRVLQAESDDMVAAIRANGGLVEYVVFDDEGHGFRKNANRIEGMNAVLAFLDAHLRG